MTPIAKVYHYGFAGPVGAQPTSRADLPLPSQDLLPPLSGGGDIDVILGGRSQSFPHPTGPGEVLEIGDNRTYQWTLDASKLIPPPTDLIPESAAIQAANGTRPYVRISSSATSDDAANLTPLAPGGATFRIEGLWIGSADSRGNFAIGTCSTPDVVDWEDITLQRMTLDPGGRRADGLPITPLRLVIRGRVRRMLARARTVDQNSGNA